MTGDERPSFDKLKTMVSMPEVCELLGFEINSQNKITSPWNPTERTPSCAVYEDHVWDFSTGKGGDVVDLVQAVQPELPASRVLWLLWNKALKAGKQVGDVEQQKPRVLDRERLKERWALGNGGAWDFWEVKLGVTFTHPQGVRPSAGELWTAHYDEDGCYGIKYRDVNGNKWSEPGSQFTHRLYSFNGHYPWYRKVAVICEGESDAWAMENVLGDKADVFALPSGASCWKDHFLSDLEHAETVWVCMDRDEAGKRARDKIMLRVGYGRARELVIPGLYNDAREAIRAGWKPTIT